MEAGVKAYDQMGTNESWPVLIPTTACVIAETIRCSTCKPMRRDCTGNVMYVAHGTTDARCRLMPGINMEKMESHG